MTDQALIRAPTFGGHQPQLPRERLGDIVVSLGFCARESVETAVGLAAASGELLGEVLVELGALTTDQLAIAMAKRFGLQHRALEEITLQPTACEMISYAAARRMSAVPVAIETDGTLVVAIANPENFLALEDISMFTGMQITPVVVSQDDLGTLLKRLSVLDGDLIEQEESTPELADGVLLEAADDAPTIRLVRSIISDAVDRGVSDIHFSRTKARSRCACASTA